MHLNDKKDKQHERYVQKRKAIVMDEAWWGKQKELFHSEDEKRANDLGFTKSEHEIQKDWEARRQELIEANTTYIDIYEITDQAPKRIFLKKEENLQKAKELTNSVVTLVEEINKGKHVETNKKKLSAILIEELFDGVENNIPNQMRVSSLCGWEIEEHIVCEDDFEIEETE